MYFLLLLSLVVVAVVALAAVVVAVGVVVIVVVGVVLVTVILIVLSGGSSKILTWTGKYKPGAIAGARAGKYKYPDLITNLIEPRTGKLMLNHLIGDNCTGCPVFVNIHLVFLLAICTESLVDSSSCIYHVYDLIMNMIYTRTATTKLSAQIANKNTRCIFTKTGPLLFAFRNKYGFQK